MNQTNSFNHQREKKNQKIRMCYYNKNGSVYKILNNYARIFNFNNQNNVDFDLPKTHGYLHNLFTEKLQFKLSKNVTKMFYSKHNTNKTKFKALYSYLINKTIFKSLKN